MRVVLTTLLLIGTLVAMPRPASAVDGGGHCDFDGDGFDDAAIGVDWENLSGVEDAGAVNVLYGSSGKLTAVGDQFWTQNSKGIANTAEERDHFGSAVECGDFNDDGYDDLVIAAYSEAIDFNTAGAVHVLFGSSEGLTSDGDLYLHRAAPGVNNQVDGDDYFGSSLAVGDFNHDGHDDLAVGVLDARTYRRGGGYVEYAGSVHVFYGDDDGLSTSNDEVWHQGKKGIKGRVKGHAYFGSSLASGDFDGDGYADLAVGVPRDRIGGERVGSVSIIYGTTDGLTGEGNQRIHRGSSGIKGDPATNVSFGGSLAAGDFEGDGYDDVAVGAPGDDEPGAENAGSVHVIRGSSNGLTPVGDKIWHQGRNALKGTAESGDWFGSSLTTGRFDSDATDDLAIGIVFDDPDGVTDAGSVLVIYGSLGGLTGAGDQLWHQGKTGIKGSNEEDDRFGASISTGDFDGNGRDDLLVGVPHDDGGAVLGAGKVAVIYADAEGLTRKGDQTWDQDSPGVKNKAELGDRMGKVSGA